MKIMNNRKHQGFTLLELIIYIGIVSLILVVISYLLIDILESQIKSFAILEIEQNARFVLHKIESDIRRARNILSISENSLTLDDGSAQNIILIIDPVAKKISRKIGESPVVNLTTDQIEVSGYFSDLSYDNRSKNVGIYLNINYKNPDNLPQYQASQIIQESIELKGRR